MANPWRGEVDLRTDAGTHALRLTLGALASLEASFGAESLVDLAERIERGGLRSQDVIAILAAGFRGAGQTVTEDEVAAMAVEGGAAEAMRVAIALMTLAFGGGRT